MRINAIGLFAALLLLAACATAPDETASTSGEGAADDTQTAAVSAAPVEAEAVQGTEPLGPVPGTQQDRMENVGDRIFFDYDSAVLKPSARSTIERQVEWLKLFPEITLTLEGHCDERGTREYNLALGERRSTAVKNYMVALGMDAGRLTTISYGKERPVSLGHNAAAWTQNRRSVSVVN